VARSRHHTKKERRLGGTPGLQFREEVPTPASHRLARRSLVVAGLVATLTAGLRAQDAGSTNPLLDALLARAGDYVETYDKTFSAVVSEEKYDQVARTRATVAGRRALRSDVLLINGGAAGFFEFRDVFEVDGKPVRDRTDRLYQLFLHPSPDAIEQATKILDEGARFNVGPITRTINVPTLALAFLHRDAQVRSAFEWDGEATVNGVRTAVLRFHELAEPRMIHTVDAAPASGRFWIEPDTGRVVRTELVINSTVARAQITVTYAPQAKLKGLWTPVRMEESYGIGATRSINGTATYTNFRQFNVDVATVIK
jgi:hypothetical protein